MKTVEYVWRDWLTLYLVQYRVVIDESAGTITFENCLRPKRFWNLFALRRLTIRYGEILKSETYQSNGYRCISIETATAFGVLLHNVPRFDDFVARMRRLVPCCRPQS